MEAGFGIAVGGSEPSDLAHDSYLGVVEVVVSSLVVLASSTPSWTDRAERAHLDIQQQVARTAAEHHTYFDRTSAAAAEPAAQQRMGAWTVVAAAAGTQTRVVGTSQSD